MDLPGGIEGVCEVEVFGASAAPRRGWVLVEVPHGATRTSDYQAVASKLKSPLPAQLDHFFYVNTDIGAPEGARVLGRLLAGRGLGVVLVRCVVPRTFVDPNRVVGGMAAGEVRDGLTPAVQGYITDPADVRWLVEQHTRYHRLVAELYRRVCGEAKGLALQLHSYAPRSVDITRTDAHIVEALHAAYQPETYATWPERPPIDLICATQDGSFHTNPALTAALVKAFAAIGLQARQNGTYHLHEVTMGYQYAKAWPDQVVCVEMNRALVADPFVPFGVSPISEAKVTRLVTPIAEVLAAALLKG